MKCKIFLKILMNFSKFMQTILFFIFRVTLKKEKDKVNTLLVVSLNYFQSLIWPSFKN